MNVAYTPSSAMAWTDRKRSYTGIWLGLAGALLLHLFIILLPIINQAELTEPVSRNIEIRVSRYTPEPIAVPAPEVPQQPPLEQQPEPVERPPDLPQTQPAFEPPLPAPLIPETNTTNTQLPLPAQIADPAMETREQRLQKLAPGILSSQFISEKSASDRIFGPSLPQDPQPVRRDFHFPQKPNMITMLDRPVSDLPFAYKPGLVQFAYDPGVKGDFQRFFDKITPEFGWKNNYGTQYKCKWILVIAACGWGRIKEPVSVKAQFLKPDKPERFE